MAFARAFRSTRFAADLHEFGSLGGGEGHNLKWIQPILDIYMLLVDCATNRKVGPRLRGNLCGGCSRHLCLAKGSVVLWNCEALKLLQVLDLWVLQAGFSGTKIDIDYDKGRACDLSGEAGFLSWPQCFSGVSQLDGEQVGDTCDVWLEAGHQWSEED